MSCDVSSQCGDVWRVATSGEVPVIDDQRGIAVDVGQQSGGYGGFTLVSGTLGAKRSHCGGVGAALGGKVAAEAEHVRPRDQS